MKKQQCVQCSKTFEITGNDEQFYSSVKAPLPTHCPDCRAQRRMVWRNERTLYNRNCDLCKKPIVAIYDPASPYIVYCYDCWYSDKWDGVTYGRDIDFNRPFFEQFKELQLAVPRVYAMALDNENSEYTNGSAYNKDCYLIFVSDHNEDCMYSYGILNCVSSVDNLNVTKSELTYGCIGCTNCYDVQYSIDSSNCNSSMFLLDCKGSSNCFMSYGLRNKQYVWRNKQLTKEEYTERWEKLNRGSYNAIQKLREEFNKLKQKHTFKYYHGLHNENFSGDYLERCHNTYDSYESYELDNCKFTIHGNKIKDAYDTYVVVDESQMVCEVVSGIDLYNVKYSYSYWHGQDGTYCDSIYYGKNLFGCVGLRHTDFAILNKKYSEAEYYTLRDKLIEHMKQTGEYGEYFPHTISPFAYNETVANDYYPRTQSAVEANDWTWKPDTEREIKYSSYAIADHIEKVKPDITAASLTCEQCKKNYKILQRELEFYQERVIPVPRTCHDCRHRARLHDRNPRSLWHRQCMCTQPNHDHNSQQCPRDFKTTYSEENPTIVYCEECYSATIH